MTAPGTCTLTWVNVAEAYREGWQDRGSYDINHIPDPRDAGLTAEDFRHASVVLGDLRHWNLAMMIDALSAAAGEQR